MNKTDGQLAAPPPSDPENTTFVAAAREGRFLIRRCTSCKKAHWYPRTFCPFCRAETAWEEASGRGKIYACSTLTRAKPPYTIAYVTLAEGPTMMTNIVDADPATLKIGQDVKIAFREAKDGTPVPCFTPVAT